MTNDKKCVKTITKTNVGHQNNDTVCCADREDCSDFSPVELTLMDNLTTEQIETIQSHIARIVEYLNENKHKTLKELYDNKSRFFDYTFNWSGKLFDFFYHDTNGTVMFVGGSAKLVRNIDYFVGENDIHNIKFNLTKKTCEKAKTYNIFDDSEQLLRETNQTVRQVMDYATAYYHNVFDDDDDYDTDFEVKDFAHAEDFLLANGFNVSECVDPVIAIKNTLVDVEEMLKNGTENEKYETGYRDALIAVLKTLNNSQDNSVKK